MVTQVQIAEHLGITKQAVSKQLQKMNINWQLMSLDEIRLAYIDRLRKSAAGQTDEYIAVKMRRETIESEILLLKLQKEKEILVDKEQLYPELQMLFLGLKQRMMGFPARVKSELDAIHGISVDETLLVEMVEDALKGLSEYIASHSKHLGADSQRDGASETDDDNGLGGGVPGDEPEIDGAPR